MNSSTDSPFLNPELGMILAVIAVSTGSIIIRLVQSDVNALVIAFFRLAISSVIMLPFAFSRRDEALVLSRKHWGVLLFGGLCLALHFASWISSLRFTTVMSSVVFVNTSPLWVALFTPLFLRETISRGVKISLAVTFMGTCLVASSGMLSIEEGRLIWQGLASGVDRQVWVGNFLALAGAWFACGFLLVGRRLRSVISLPLYTFLLYGIAAVIMLVIMLVARQPIGTFRPEIYIWLVLLALVPQLMGHSMFNWALKYVSAAYVAVVLLGEPVGASILAMVFLKEVPGVLEIFGASVILVGIYLATVFEKADKKIPPQDRC